MEMKKKLSSARTLMVFVCIFVLIINLLACDDQNSGSSANLGKLRLSLAADTTSSKKGIDSNPTKAVSDEFDKFLTVEDYQIQIVADNDTIKSYDRFDKMPSEIELPEGAYTVIASKGNNLPAAFENPYFEGSTAFSIKEGMNTPLDVTCSLGNARITVDYTEDFKEAYSDYTVLLSSTFTSGSLEIGKADTRPAYVQVAKEGSELGVAIRLKKVTEEQEKTYKIPTALTIERRQNIRLIFKTDGEALDGIGLEVILDDEMTNVTLNEGIPDFMWKPFEKPRLMSESFGSGEFTINPGGLTEKPSVIFQVPAGIGGFYIDQWRVDNVLDADTIRYNLAITEKANGINGAKEAKEAGYSWNLSNENLAGIRIKGQLNLQMAINNLKAPEGDVPFVYYLRIYACDQLAKKNYTETLLLKVQVNKAGAPVITIPQEMPSTIIEGDAVLNDIIVVISAGSGIDKDNTTITIGEDGRDKVYKLIDDALQLNALGIEVDKVNNTQINLKFKKNFTEKLSANESTDKLYVYSIELQDQSSEKKRVSTKHNLTVQIPQFSLETNEGDAFAKRIVLRANMPVGRKDKLEFQYQREGDGDYWTYATSGLENETDYNYTDTVKGLDITTRYRVRAVYNRKRYSEEMVVETETPGTIPNAQFEDWSIKPDIYGNNEEGHNAGSIMASGTLQSPYRCWEVWQPWNDESSKGWNTLNELTTSEGTIRKDNPKVSFLDGIAGVWDWTIIGYPWARYSSNSGTSQAQGVDGSYAALIQTVGWGGGNSAGGEVPLGSNNITFPSVIKNTTPGELYLGRYDIEAKKPSYGIDFDSRPTAVSFDYKYVSPMGKNEEDSFIAEFVVLDKEGNTIAVQRLNTTKKGAVSSWTEGVIRLDYKGDLAQKKAAKMYIRFVSGTVKTTGDQSVFPIQPGFGDLSNGQYAGSLLYIDNVKLIYE